MALNNYTAVYGADEASEVSIDLLISVGALFVSFASLISLLVLFNWAKSKFRR